MGSGIRHPLPVFCAEPAFSGQASFDENDWDFTGHAQDCSERLGEGMNQR